MDDRSPEAASTTRRSQSNRILLKSAADRLPTPDGVAMAIMEIWESDQTSINELSRLVQTDPALSGRVLKLANSAASGLRPTASIPTAIARVGMQTVGQLAVAFSLIGKKNSDDCPAFNRQQYWTRCLLMAVLSRGLGRLTRVAAPDDLFACGLLTRIGVLGLASVYPEAYSEVLSSHSDDLSELEKQTFGTDHNELSEIMMLDLLVPGTLAEPARHHESPDESGYPPDSHQQDVALLLNLAYYLSEAAVHDDRTLRRNASRIEMFRERMKLPEGRIEAIFRDALAQWREWSELLRLADDKVRQHEARGSQSESAEGDRDTTPSPEPLSAAIVADPGIAGPLTESLTALGIQYQTCSKSSEAIHLTLTHRANILFISKSDTQLIDMVRSTANGGGIHIVVAQPGDQPEPEAEAQAYASGADDVIAAGAPLHRLKPRLNPALRRLESHARWQAEQRDLQRIAEDLSLSHREHEVLAMTDPLTHLPNRRAGVIALERVWQGSVRAETNCTVLVMDIDHFKSINDEYGHAVGDQVLCKFASVLKAASRGDETIARMGGEEFMLVSSNLALREAVVTGDRLRKKIERTDVPTDIGTLHITVSVGIAVREAQMHESATLVIAADRALYAAKDAGRNRIAVSSDGKLNVADKANG